MRMRSPPCYDTHVKASSTAKIWDVAVIGGGPSGMMAAGTAASRGAKVVLIEKNDTLGKKLLITGGGRCNVTNGELHTRTFLAKFKKNDKFLFSPFSQWGVKETLEFFHTRGMDTIIEAEQRVFPATHKAQSVWDVLVAYIREHKVTVISHAPVVELVKEGESITKIILADGRTLRATSIILATGGKSRPETGSTGDGYAWLRTLGHTVVESDPTLVPISIKDLWVRRLAGVSLTDIKITLYQNKVKQSSRVGKILFTHVGVSGPTILNMSKDVGELLKYGPVTIALDLLPKLDNGALNLALQKVFTLHANKQFKNALADFVPSALAPILVELSQIAPEIKCNSITREERIRLIEMLKRLPLSVKGLLGVDKAIVTSGGVALEEIDFKTMRSQRIKNLYLVGDILNIDRPSGGYSLQLCWTTGYVAGTSVTW